MSYAGAILIVDHEESFVDALAERLRDEGHDCDTAVELEQAIEKLRTNRYDLLIAATEMPGSRDLQVARESQALTGGIPVVLVSASPSLHLAIQALELPVVAYLAKPVDHDLLLKRISSLLDSMQSRRTVMRVIRDLCRCVEDLKTSCSWSPLHRQPGVNRGLPFADPTIRALICCLRALWGLQGDSSESRSFCETVGCLSSQLHRAAVEDAIDVLQTTKRRFKSKELADLRDRLERHLEKMERQVDRSPLRDTVTQIN